MQFTKTVPVGLIVLFGMTLPALSQLKDAPHKDGFPKFKVQEVLTDLAIGYAVITADVNGDGKPDIVIVDKHRVLWLENPTWKRRIILEGKTKPDNVCIAAGDFDGDGQIDFVIGAGWKPFDTKTPGTLQWVKRGKTLDDEWTIYPIPCDEPTVHRVQVGDIDHDGKPDIILAPLMGRESTAAKNWMDGRPVRILSYPTPADPTKPENWKPTVISEELHVVHGIQLTDAKLKDGKFLMITVDGRTESSGGIGLQDLAEYLLSLGATDAMNLDGGGSTTMFVDGKVVNHPSDKEGERKVSDAILVTPRKK